MFTTALENAQKFVPNVQVGAGGDGVVGMLMAILGHNLATPASGAVSPGSAVQPPARR